MTQYQHNYVRSQVCNNMIDTNGVVHSGPCQHIRQYIGPHCHKCGLEESHSVHIKDDE